MKIQITQPDTYLASAAVRITIDGKFLGVIGPGESVYYEDPTHDERFPYEFVATCGHMYTTYYGHRDINLQVHWSFRSPHLTLQKTDHVHPLPY